MISGAALLAALAAGSPSAPAVHADTIVPADTIAYAIAPVFAGHALAGLAVEIRFRGEADGETRLFLPDAWAGSDELWKNLGSLRVRGAISVREDGPAVRVITHAPGAPLSVAYEVRSAYEAEPGIHYRKALPLVLPGWFFFHGEGVFATPEGSAGVPARFTWRDFPAEWTLASDLDHLAGERPGTVQDVVQSAAIGAPDLTVIRREIDGAPLRVAIRGEWRFEPGELVDRLERVITAANRQWSDPGRPYFVPFAPLGGTEPGVSYTGTGRTDGFSVASTPGFELGAALHFLAHEYLHTWLPEELGGHLEQDGPLGYWFSEGFTDFFAARLLVASGNWTLADYVDSLNRGLVRYAASPARDATGADIVERFWTDSHIQRLPYDRGLLFAHLVDHRIRQSTGGRSALADVLRAQRQRALRDASEGRRVAAATLFPIVLREQVGLDIDAELGSHVHGGEPIRLPSDLLGPCARIEAASQPEFALGFDLPATRQARGVVTGTDPAGPAYAAGLRDGMQILRREAGTSGDASVEMAYAVVEGEGERVIRYLPHGRGRIHLQRVAMTPGAAETCRTDNPSTP
jgi:predicted metalloprotease with PDZ domain